MAVKIMIKRKASNEKLLEVLPYLKKLRVLAMSQDGYIGGETLKRVDDPEEILVVSTWQSMDQWKAWFENPERNELQEKIDSILGEKTEYCTYIYQ